MEKREIENRKSEDAHLLPTQIFSDLFFFSQNFSVIFLTCEMVFGDGMENSCLCMWTI